MSMAQIWENEFPEFAPFLRLFSTYTKLTPPVSVRKGKCIYRVIVLSC